MKKILVILLMMLTIVGLTACGEITPAQNTSYQDTIKKNEEVVKNLTQNKTLPRIDDSLEWENVKRRIEFINQPDRVGYLYLFADNGVLIEEVQVLGKISSLNSYITPMEQIEWYRGIDLGEAYGDVPIVLQAPDLDGTYGENAQGVFWFDMDGEYQEWNGTYQYSSFRKTFTTQPILINSIE